MYNMATELDLDINNYNINDIEKFFRFKPTSKYNQSEIELRECEIREQLLSSGHINKKLKRDLIAFLITAKQWLIDIKCKKDVPTSIPKNFRLDQDNYPRSKEPSSREENIIEKPQTQFIYTQPSDYYPGSLNPLDKRIVTKLVCIDTLFRQNYNRTKSTDFVYTLPDSINNVVSMQLIATEIPRLWHSFSSIDSTNQMIIQINNVCCTDQNGNFLDNSGNLLSPQPSTGSTYFADYQFTINVPDGNYLDSTFQEIINKILLNQTIDDYNVNGFSIPGTPNGTWALRFIQFIVDPISTCTIIRANNRIADTNGTFCPPCPFEPMNEYYSPNFSFNVKFNTIPTRPYYLNMGWMLGFRNPSYICTSANSYISYSYLSNIAANSTIIYQGYLKSESSFGSSFENYIFIEVDDYHNNFPTDTIISMNTDSYLGKNIIARITLTSGTNTIVDDNGSDRIFKKREYFGPVKIEKLHIRLLNRFGNVINFNQNDFSFALELKQIYSL